MKSVTYSQELPITDADGKPVVYRKVVPVCDHQGIGIFPGSVLENVKDKERGVVNHVYKAGDRSVLGLACEGDLAIRISAGSTRITNKYSDWRHVPHAEQTYGERFQSWLARPYHHDDDYKQSSRDEGLAVDGIMALLPEDIVDWNYGPFPDRIDDALKYLADHLTTLQPKPSMTLDELNGLSDEELNRRLAELVGWKRLDGRIHAGLNRGYYYVSRPDGSPWYEWPAYCSDLNAVATVEAGLKGNQVLAYNKHLELRDSGYARICDFTAYPDDYIWNATAKQRTVALIQTLALNPNQP